MGRKYLDRRVHAFMSAKNAIGVRGITVFDSADPDEMKEYDQRVFGFDGEEPLQRALADIATNMMMLSYEDDIGMVVDVRPSDAQDYGSMITDVMSASTEEELREVADVYGDMPGAEALLQVCASRLGVELRRAV